MERLGSALMIAYLLTLVIPLGLVALLLTLIVRFSRRRVHWEGWEVMGFVMPFVTWVFVKSADLYFPDQKENSAYPAELLYLALAIIAAALVRAGVGARLREPVVAASLLAVLCLIAGALRFIELPFTG
jgi:hypothetical protein